GKDGTLTVFADGSYSYSVTSHTAATDTFTLTTLDQNGFVTSTTLTFGVPVVNHAATITVSLTEDNAVLENGGVANATAGDPTASGQLTVHDVDSGEDHFQTPVSLAG